MARMKLGWRLIKEIKDACHAVCTTTYLPCTSSSGLLSSLVDFVLSNAVGDAGWIENQGSGCGCANGEETIRRRTLQRDGCGSNSRCNVLLAKIPVMIDKRYYYVPWALELEHPFPVSLRLCIDPRTIVLLSYASEGCCLLRSKTSWSKIGGWAMISGGLNIALKGVCRIFREYW